jgi:uncharacterized protein
VNLEDYEGYTPLHVAALAGNTDMVALLIKYGATLDTRLDRGQTPLDLAKEQGHTHLFKLLER